MNVLPSSDSILVEGPQRLGTRVRAEIAGFYTNALTGYNMEISDPDDIAMVLEALHHHRNWLQERANGMKPYPRELRPQAEAGLERAKALMARIRAAR